MPQWSPRATGGGAVVVTAPNADPIEPQWGLPVTGEGTTDVWVAAHYLVDAAMEPAGYRQGPIEPAGD
jgi:hypothetical protein